jgi:hypothetical protein
MPTIKFKLADPRFCDGCPCIQIDDFYGSPASCNLLFSWDEDPKVPYHKPYPPNKQVKSKRLKRPQACIDKHGE